MSAFVQISDQVGYAATRECPERQRQQAISTECIRYAHGDARFTLLVSSRFRCIEERKQPTPEFRSEAVVPEAGTDFSIADEAVIIEPRHSMILKCRVRNGIRSPRYPADRGRPPTLSGLRCRPIESLLPKFGRTKTGTGLSCLDPVQTTGHRRGLNGR